MGPHDALRSAIEKAGSQAKLAKAVDVAQSNISFWLSSSKLGVRAEYVLPIEAVTGISRHDLRPDLYPPPAQPSATEVAA